VNLLIQKRMAKKEIYKDIIVKTVEYILPLKKEKTTPKNCLKNISGTNKQ
jgi:hypothetical protein